MSGHVQLAEALEALLGGDTGLGVVINGVFHTPPTRAVRPYVVIDDAVLVDWGTKDMAGREGRLSITIFGDEDRQRLRAAADQVAAIVPNLPRLLGAGWQIASLAFVRSRIVREAPGMCAAIVEFRVRMLQVS